MLCCLVSIWCGWRWRGGAFSGKPVDVNSCQDGEGFRQLLERNSAGYSRLFVVDNNSAAATTLYCLVFFFTFALFVPSNKNNPISPIQSLNNLETSVLLWESTTLLYIDVQPYFDECFQLLIAPHQTSLIWTWKFPHILPQFVGKVYIQPTMHCCLMRFL
jgi:hypothetical protein